MTEFNTQPEASGLSAKYVAIVTTSAGSDAARPNFALSETSRGPETYSLLTLHLFLF